MNFIFRFPTRFNYSKQIDFFSFFFLDSQSNSSAEFLDFIISSSFDFRLFICWPSENPTEINYASMFDIKSFLTNEARTTHYTSSWRCVLSVVRTRSPSFITNDLAAEHNFIPWNLRLVSINLMRLTAAFGESQTWTTTTTKIKIHSFIVRGCAFNSPLYCLFTNREINSFLVCLCLQFSLYFYRNQSRFAYFTPYFFFQISAMIDSQKRKISKW